MAKVEPRKSKSPMSQDEIVDLFHNIVDLEDDIAFMNKTQPVNITLSRRDIERLEKQIDRAIQLGLRTKNKSAIIRMALRALEKSSDDKYFSLYQQE